MLGWKAHETYVRYNRSFGRNIAIDRGPEF